MEYQRHLLFASCVLVFAVTFASPARAQQVDCLQCHQALAAKKAVHPALQAGCATCHAAIDATAMPHKVTGKIAKGLAAEPPELCFNCHGRKMFEGKFVHAPAAAGMCVFCHDPHSSEYVKLLKKEPVELCLGCHDGVKKTPHVIAGFFNSGHPLGEKRKDRSEVAEDPLRPGRKFYCGSCHEPHKADFARLTRFDTRALGGFCHICHRL